MRYGTNYSSSARIRCQLAAWLNQYDWDWFATITFREEIETVTARGRVRAFLQTIERTYKRHVGAFIVYEMHKYRGDDPRRRLIPHVHMLVANVHDVYRRGPGAFASSAMDVLVLSRLRKIWEPLITSPSTSPRKFLGVETGMSGGTGSHFLNLASSHGGVLVVGSSQPSVVHVLPSMMTMRILRR